MDAFIIFLKKSPEVPWDLIKWRQGKKKVHECMQGF